MHNRQLELPLYPYKIHRRNLWQYWQPVLEETGAACVEEAVLGLYEQGLSIRQIAEKTTFSYSEIHLILVQTGATLRPPGGNNNPWGCKGRPDKQHWH